MKKTITAAALALAGTAALALGACSPSGSAGNDSAVTELSVNEGEVATDGNFGGIDDFGNAAASANLLLDNASTGDAAPGNATLGNEGAVANGL